MQIFGEGWKKHMEGIFRNISDMFFIRAMTVCQKVTGQSQFSQANLTGKISADATHSNTACVWAMIDRMHLRFDQ